MLKLNVNQEKQLTFEVQIGGVHQDQVTSQFKITIGEIAYTFPAKVGRDEITVDLPPLHKVIGAKIKEGDEADVQLEIIADGHYLTPWRDRAVLSNPLVLEVKIKDSAFVENPAFQTRLTTSEDGAKQVTTVESKKEPVKEIKSEETIATELVEKISAKLEAMIEAKEAKENKDDKTKEEDKEDDKTKEEDKKEEDTKQPTEEGCKKVSESKTEKLEKLLNKTIDTFKLNEDKKQDKKKEITLEDFKKNLSKKDILNYMKKQGTKSTEIQEIIYEQAKLSAKKETPIYILKAVADILKK